MCQPHRDSRVQNSQLDQRTSFVVWQFHLPDRREDQDILIHLLWVESKEIAQSPLRYCSVFPTADAEWRVICVPATPPWDPVLLPFECATCAVCRSVPCRALRCARATHRCVLS